MYLLEIELLRQDHRVRQQKGLSPERREGDYYLEKRYDTQPLQQLAKECWQYKESACSHMSVRPSSLDTHNERLFQQQIQDSAQQLVTTLAQQPFSITQILRQLEQEQPEVVYLGKLLSGKDILRIVDSPSVFTEIKGKVEIPFKESLT